MVQIAFDANLYSADHLKKAAYKFIDKFSFQVATKGSELVCDLELNPNIGKDAEDYYINQFKKEVLDQELRDKLKKETEAVRNLILAHTFSKTGLISDE